MASSYTLSNLSTLRVFNEENSRFILDPTLQDLDQGLPMTDSFISPPGFKLPLVAPWFHISKCLSKFSAWPSPSALYIQWLNRVANKKGEDWKQLGIYDMIILSKKEMLPNFELLYGFLSLWNTLANAFILLFGMMSLTLHDVTAVIGLLVDGDEIPFLHDVLSSDVDF